MLRFLLAALPLALVLTEATAQTKPRSASTPYSTRGPRKARPAVKINPHTGKPYGAGVPQDIKDGTAYLAPGMPMRKQVGYTANGGYNDNRAPRPRYAKPANSTLNRDSKLPLAPAKTKAKAGRR